MRLLLFASLLLLLPTGCQVPQAAFDRDRVQCQRNMRSIECVVREFAGDHGERYPAALDDALSDLGFNNAEKSARMLRCPGTAARAVAGTDFAARAGFHYVDWSRWFGQTNPPPASYPLIYDRSLRNHGGEGVNVVSVDGGVSWDAGGRTLRAFVAAHPEYQLPLPK